MFCNRKMHEEIWSVDSPENYWKCCHQMSDSVAKMHQIRFWLGLHPGPRWGAYSAPPDPLAGFKGPTSKGREGREGEGRIRKKERGGRGKGNGGESVPLAVILQFDHCLIVTIRDVLKPNFRSVSVYKNPNRTEPKPKGQIRNFGFRGFSQNRICFIHIVNI